METINFELNPELDIDAFTSFQALLSQPPPGEAEMITLDMSRVGHINANGVALLLSAYKSCKQKGLKMAVIHVAPGISTVLKAVGADRYFELRQAAAPEPSTDTP
jgi:anti-anti-sigma factor